MCKNSKNILLSAVLAAALCFFVCSMNRIEILKTASKQLQNSFRGSKNSRNNPGCRKFFGRGSSGNSHSRYVIIYKIFSSI